MKEENTIEENEAKRLFENVSIPEPKRELLQSILNTYQPAVTKNTTVRIPYQKDGRPSLITQLNNRMRKAIKSLVPVLTVFAILVLVVYNKTNTGSPLATIPPTAYKLENVTTNASIDNDLSLLINDYETDFQNEEKTMVDFNEQSATIQEESTLTNFDSLYENDEL